MTKNGVVIQPSVNSGYQPKYKRIQPPPTCFKTSFDPMTSEAGDLEEVSEEVEAQKGAVVGVQFISYLGSRFLEATESER